MSIAACARESRGEMARRCERTHVPDCFLKCIQRGGSGGKGQKKENEMIYAASQSVIQRNLVFHAGLKVVVGGWGGGVVTKTHQARWSLHVCHAGVTSDSI